MAKISRAKGVDLTYTVDTSRPQAKIQSITQRLEANKIAGFLMATGVPYLQEQARERFESQNDGKWQPLKEVTQRIREAEGYTPIKINERTGAMRAWVEDAPGYVVSNQRGISSLLWPKVAPNKLTQQKLKTAQQGKWPTAKEEDQGFHNPTPPRPVLMTNARDMLAFGTMFNAYLRAAVS